MVASVPELTSRTCSTGVTRRTISSASSTSPGPGAPNDRPLPAARRAASTTAGCACPRIVGPHEQARSTYSLPSTSYRYGPAARTMKRGVPPTAPNARTGELTPPGVTATARANHCAEVSTLGMRTSSQPEGRHCRAGQVRQMARATDEEIAQWLSAHGGWRREGEAIVRTIECASFPAAITVVNRVAELAEERD